jgi:hypothetical protein
MTAKVKKPAQRILLKLQHIPLRAYSIAGVLVFAAVATALLVNSRAATPTASLEPEAGSRSGNVIVVSDSVASGGSAVEFGVAEEVCATTGEGGYPLPNLVGYTNSCNTGPRYECTSTLSGLTTSSNGQVIERVCINGSLEIRHDNVTVRDVKIMGTGTYALDIGQNMTVCPSNLRVEFTEVNMINAANMDIGVYQRCKSTVGVHTFDRMEVHNAGRGMMMYGNIVITNSYFYSSRTAEGAHRTSLSTHGGDNFTVTGSTFICVNTGCSSSVNMYSDYAPVTNYLFQSNVLAGGSICLRGGETHSFPNDTHDIRVLNNRFSQVYYPECGSLQEFAQFDESAPGNVRSGNVYHESGLPIPGE